MHPAALLSSALLCSPLLSSSIARHFLPHSSSTSSSSPTPSHPLPHPCPYPSFSPVQDLATHMNRRHKAAQHAQRASVNLHTLLFFKYVTPHNTAPHYTRHTDKQHYRYRYRYRALICYRAVNAETDAHSDTILKQMNAHIFLLVLHSSLNILSCPILSYPFLPYPIS